MEKPRTKSKRSAKNSDPGTKLDKGKPRLFWKYYKFGQGYCHLFGRLGSLQIRLGEIHPAMVQAFALSAIAQHIMTATRNVYRATQDEDLARKAADNEWERIKAGKVRFYDVAEDDTEKLVCKPLAEALLKMGKKKVKWGEKPVKITEENLLEIWHSREFNQRLGMMGSDFIRMLRDRPDIAEVLATCMHEPIMSRGMKDPTTLGRE